MAHQIVAALKTTLLGVGHLDGNKPIQLFIVRQIDEPKAPFPHDPLDAVTTDPLRVLVVCSVDP